MLYFINYVGYIGNGINRSCFLCVIKEQSLYILRMKNINLKKIMGKATRKKLKAKIILSIYSRIRINIREIDWDETILSEESIESILLHYIHSSFWIPTGSGTELVWCIRKLGE